MFRTPVHVAMRKKYLKGHWIQNRFGTWVIDYIYTAFGIVWFTAILTWKQIRDTYSTMVAGYYVWLDSSVSLSLPQIQARIKIMHHKPPFWLISVDFNMAWSQGIKQKALNLCRCCLLDVSCKIFLLIQLCHNRIYALLLYICFEHLQLKELM